MHIARDVVDELGIEDHGVHGRALLHRPDGLVEVPAAPAETHPATVDGGRRDDEEVDVVDGDRAEDVADGLGETEQPLGDLRVGGGHRPVEQAVFARDGEQHTDATGHRAGHEGVRAGFGRRRQEARDAARAQVLDEGVELLFDAGLGDLAPVGGDGLASFAQIRTQSALGLLDAVGHAVSVRACAIGNSAVACHQ